MSGHTNNPDPKRLIGRQLGDYRLVDLLGEGGMGAVYLGEVREIESRVAVKVLHREHVEKEDMVQRFMSEARAVNRVAHPGLVKVHSWGEDDEAGIYLVMEYLDGRSLRRVLRDEGPLSPARAARLGAQVASALGAVHGKNIIHRDLKPENIMLVPDPDMVGGERVKVLDFGIAKLRGDASIADFTTRSGMVMGTPLYMAPEQCTDSKTVDHRADIYSLGAVTYELMTGRPPFLAESLGALIKQQITEVPDPVQTLAHDISEPMGEAVMRAIDVDPHQRFQTMEAFAAALRGEAGEPADVDLDPAWGSQTLTIPPGGDTDAVESTEPGGPADVEHATTEQAGERAAAGQPLLDTARPSTISEQLRGESMRRSKVDPPAEEQETASGRPVIWLAGAALAALLGAGLWFAGQGDSTEGRTTPPAAATPAAAASAPAPAPAPDLAAAPAPVPDPDSAPAPAPDQGVPDQEAAPDRARPGARPRSRKRRRRMPVKARPAAATVSPAPKKPAPKPKPDKPELLFKDLEEE